MEPSRQDFCHPYQPYDIQSDFMTNLYHCIEHKKVGIFESPTGTGKSLSLICASLTWLRDHKRQAVENAVNSIESGGDPEWIVEAERNARRKELLYRRRELEQNLLAARKRETIKPGRSGIVARNVKKPVSGQQPSYFQLLMALQRGNDCNTPELEKADDAFMLDEYASGDDDEEANKSKKKPHGTLDALSAETRALLGKLGGVESNREEVHQADEIKILFCSRTHSQLTQFIGELRRVKPPPSIDPEEDTAPTEDQAFEPVKHLPLGSRKNLCINPKVLRLNTTTAVNERCLELQKPGTSKESRCSFLPSQDGSDRALVLDFHDRVLAQIRDIEDLGDLGRKVGVCPYYASRPVIDNSEILTLPYPLLLQRSAREALGLSIKGNVVIIDEAHNLMDAITDTYSVSITLSQLEKAISQVTLYAQRFRTHLKGKNRVYLTQLVRLMASITDNLRQQSLGAGQNEIEVSANQLMAGKGVDQIRPQKLVRYLQESKLAYKVEGYIASAGEGTPSQSPGLLMTLQGFLIVLMNPSKEGRFFYFRQDQTISVRYVLLDPREHFRDIVEEARAVILAGGTMSPMSDYADYLFSYLSPGRLQIHSFGHVIPPQNLFVGTISSGCDGVDFNFNFENRKSEHMIMQLGDMVLRTCQTVPDGVVAFFPSYDYLTQVLKVWKRPQAGSSFLKMIEAIKSVFEESKDGSIHTEDLLRDYAQAIDNGKGALLLSVVGGKLSEGINFSDKLGRAVIAVGLPFPNAQGAEWKAKIGFVEHASYKKLSETNHLSEQQCKMQAQMAGRDFYENACMRAVNQGIGRAIRHRNDWAAILLVDKRYSSERIQGKLPRWIRTATDTSRVGKSVAEVERSLKDFFTTKL
jgi:chromosome transmission fidelity protein 1